MDQTTIYVAENHAGLKKIGFAKRPRERLSQFQTGSGSDIAFVHHRHVPSDDAWRIEAHAHLILKPHWRRGEWFDIGLQDAISAIDAAVIATAAGEPVKRTVGRKMEFPDRITLPLAAGVVARIDSVLQPNEPRLDLIREAIEREIKRRERLPKPD